MGGTLLSRTVMVGLENGLHLVPCSRLVRLANSYPADVRLRKGDVLADGKNIFDLMGLAAGFGEQIEIAVSGQYHTVITSFYKMVSCYTVGQPYA